MSRVREKGRERTALFFFVCRCTIPQALHPVTFRFPIWKRGTPNICTTEGCRLPETLINHTRAITIIANSLPLVIITLAEIQQPVSFNWFNSSHSLIYSSSGPTPSLASYLSLICLLLFYAAAASLSLCSSHAFWGEESRVRWHNENLHGLRPFMGSEDVTEERKEHRREKEIVQRWRQVYFLQILEVSFCTITRDPVPIKRTLPRISSEGNLQI